MSYAPGVAPSRERGLKPIQVPEGNRDGSRSLTGAWIETSSMVTLSPPPPRRSLTGAWIETSWFVGAAGFPPSLPHGSVD